MHNNEEVRVDDRREICNDYHDYYSYIILLLLANISDDPDTKEKVYVHSVGYGDQYNQQIYPKHA